MNIVIEIYNELYQRMEASITENNVLIKKKILNRDRFDNLDVFHFVQNE